MTQHLRLARKCRFMIGGIFALLPSAALAAEPSPAALSGFDAYAVTIQSRLAKQHRSGDPFLGPAFADPENQLRLRRGELVIEQLTPAAGAGLPGALLHHWRGTAFVPGATASEFDQALRDFPAYPQRFSPQVLAARVLSRKGDRYEVCLRVRQHNVITVTMDTTYDVRFERLDAQHGSSSSSSTQIAELDADGRPLPPAREHGFLWRMDTWWSYAETDGGLYLQIETLSLTRSIPAGLGWAVRPFIESIPRNSLDFTLQSACTALRAAARATTSELHNSQQQKGAQP